MKIKYFIHHKFSNFSISCLVDYGKILLYVASIIQNNIWYAFSANFLQLCQKHDETLWAMNPLGNLTH